MGDRLDAAARLSGRTARTLVQTPLGREIRQNLLFYRRIARAAFAEAVASPPSRPAVEAARGAAPHPGLTRQPAADVAPGDDERCTCQAPDWCGATKGDIVHDLMTTGMRLDRPQAEALWREAQVRRIA